MHFKAMWLEPDYCRGWYYLDAESEQEAYDKMEALLKEDNTEYEQLRVVQMSLDELIEEEVQDAKRKVLGAYIRLKYDMDRLTVREYADIVKNLESDEEKYYQMFRDMAKYHRTCELVIKVCDLTKMTAQEMQDAIKRLWEIDKEKEFEQYLASLPHKAKSEV